MSEVSEQSCLENDHNDDHDNHHHDHDHHDHHHDHHHLDQVMFPPEIVTMERHWLETGQGRQVEVGFLMMMIFMVNLLQIMVI